MGATPHHTHGAPRRKFQFTPPYGGDHHPLRLGRHADVSIHAPVWGRLACGGPPRLVQCFNSRPRMGATFLQIFKGPVTGVSIHAPVWGRLGSLGNAPANLAVSIHAPVWGRPAKSAPYAQHNRFQFTPPYGGDAAGRGWRQLLRCFNSRPRMGATRAKLVGCKRCSHVSIHAPVWGRPPKNPSVSRTKTFQFTPPYGGDVTTSPIVAPWVQFQFTPPYGGDGRNLHQMRPHRRFNSRPRMGATQRRHLQICRYTVSIHAPVWGRRSAHWLRSVGMSFQFTPPYGGDAAPSTAAPPKKCFNSRPRMGATISNTRRAAAPMVSIHAPVWGRPLDGGLIGGTNDVSIHAPVWGRPKRREIEDLLHGFQFTPPYGGDSGSVHDLSFKVKRIQLREPGKGIGISLSFIIYIIMSIFDIQGPMQLRESSGKSLALGVRGRNRHKVFRLPYKISGPVTSIE